MHAPRRGVPGRPPERTPDPDGETRQRLLDAAAELFAERGFDGVSVRELCQAAGANVAAVNYHFGDKLGLYSELMETAVRRMRERLAAVEGAGGTAEERLRVYIRSEIERSLTPQPGSWVLRLMNREVDAPTPVLDRVVREAIRPRIEYASRLVAEIMGCAPRDPRVGVAVSHIHGLSALLRRRAIMERLLPRFRATPERIDAMAESSTRFVLAGIRELARAPGTEGPW